MRILFLQMAGAKSPSLKEKKKSSVEAKGKGKPFIALNDAEEESATSKAKKAQPYSERRAIIYISHLPHGFYEKELRQYLGQFGAITNLRVGRSKKTGVSKGYAFIEFKYPEVAKIVCETMNNYLMFNKLVKCEMVSPDKMHKKIFQGKVNPADPPGSKARRAAKKQVNRLREEEEENKRLRKQLKKLEKLKSNFAEYGLTTEVKFGSLEKSLPPTGRTPVMEVDAEELDITMKTPPHVKKIKSRSNSAAATPKTPMMMQQIKKAQINSGMKTPKSAEKKKKPKTPRS